MKILINKKGIIKVTRYFILVIFTIVSLNIFGCSKQNNEPEKNQAINNSIQEKSKAPAFTLTSTDGKKI